MTRNSPRKRITRTLLMNGAWGPRSYVVSRLLLLLLLLLLILLLLAGLPRERDARGSPILIEYGRPLFVWLSRDWSSVRVYRLYGWGRGDYEKEGRGVSGVSWQIQIFYIGPSQYGQWQLSKQDSHWPVSHDHISGSCVNSSRWHDLFVWKLSAEQLTVLLDYDQCSISYFLASLGAQENC